MRRVLLQSAAFVRAARRLAKKSPESASTLQVAFESLAADAFHPALKTHKLKGELAGSWQIAASKWTEKTKSLDSFEMAVYEQVGAAVPAA